MSGESEAFRDQLNSSLESAIAGDHDLEEASDGRMVCIVCKDDIDNRGEA